MQESTKNIKDFKDWLGGRYKKSTAKRYLISTLTYIEMIGGEHEALYMGYQDLWEYIKQLRMRGYNAQRIATDIAGVKSYHRYLFESEQRPDDPSYEIVLQDANTNRYIQHQDLFTTKELEQLLNRKNRYANIQFRNKFIISPIITFCTTIETNQIKFPNLILTLVNKHI